MRSLGAAGRVLAAAAIAAATGGCGIFDDLSDRFKTCEDTPVELINSQQTRGSVNIAGPEEAFLPENELASGASRRISLCIEKGNRKRFRVLEDGVVVAALNCVASRSSYEARVVQVIWTPTGLVCKDW
jgi:hypothetical protein